MKKTSAILITLIIIILIAVIGVGGYYFYTIIEKSNKKIEELESKINNQVTENVVNTTNTTNTTNNTSTPTTSSQSTVAFSEKDLFVNGVKLGESAKGFEAIYSNEVKTSKAYTQDATGTDVTEIDYTNLGLKVYNESSTSNPDGKITMMQIYGNSKLTTARGIKIGSSKEDVLNSYSSKSILSSDSKEIIVGKEGSDPVYGTNGIGNISFIISNGVVSKITIAYAFAE